MPMDETAARTARLVRSALFAWAGQGFTGLDPADVGALNVLLDEHGCNCRADVIDGRVAISWDR